MGKNDHGKKFSSCRKCYHGTKNGVIITTLIILVCVCVFCFWFFFFFLSERSNIFNS